MPGTTLESQLLSFVGGRLKHAELAWRCYAEFPVAYHQNTRVTTLEVYGGYSHAVCFVS